MRLRRFFLCILALTLFISALPGQAASKKKGPFEREEIKIGKIKYSYWVAAPKKVTKDLPMIVFLHGSSERDDRAMLAGFPDMIIRNKIAQPDGVILVPQLPWDMVWQRAEDFIFKTIDIVQQRYGLSDRNLVLIGFSMGANEVLSLASKYPGRFPKVICIAGRVTEEVEKNHEAYANISFRAYVGDDDTNMPPKSLIKFTQKLMEKGYDASLYTMHATHSQMQNRVFKSKGILEYLNERIPMPVQETPTAKPVKKSTKKPSATPDNDTPGEETDQVEYLREAEGLDFLDDMEAEGPRNQENQR